MVSLCRNQQLGGKPPVLHRPPQGKAPFPRSAGRGRSGSTYIVYMQPRRPVGRHRDIGGPELPHNFWHMGDFINTATLCIPLQFKSGGKNEGSYSRKLVARICIAGQQFDA